MGTLGAAGLIGGAAAGALAMNAETSEKLGLAKSYGVGVEKYAAWENIGKAAGLNGENIGDLSEELTNKIGEIGNEKKPESHVISNWPDEKTNGWLGSGKTV